MLRQCVDSRWTETLYMLHEIQSAVDLKIGLAVSLANWNVIKKGLRETPRKRKLQHQALEEIIDNYDRLC